MSIPTLIFRTIRWSAWDGCEAGMEHVDVRPADGGIAVSGVIIAQEEGTRFGLSYRLRLDALWHTKDVVVRTTSGHVLHLESNGKGSWQENGKERPDLQGCIDIDIQATPLTNTLPIRRLGMKTGESTEIRLCYITVPELTVFPSDQRYTAIDSTLSTVSRAWKTALRPSFPWMRMGSSSTIQDCSSAWLKRNSLTVTSGHMQLCWRPAVFSAKYLKSHVVFSHSKLEQQ